MISSAIGRRLLPGFPHDNLLHVAWRVDPYRQGGVAEAKPGVLDGDGRMLHHAEAFASVVLVARRAQNAALGQ